jgi:NitT/TauT family transport system substrate-binding protein
MKRFISVILIAITIIACSDSGSKSKSHLKSVVLTIDWVPSPEYYGFFVAKELQLYKKAGLDVEIKYGSGAPVVANQIASGAIPVGTTTSDNILLQIANGGKFYKAIPLLRFNPAVIASLESNPVKKLDELKEKKLGVNKQSSVYQQLLFLDRVGSLDMRLITEFPIGWGGSAQLSSGQVDAILAYTTNVVVDLYVADKKPIEIFFSDHGVHLYGLVLVFANKEKLNSLDLKDSDVKALIDATLEGYKRGADDPLIAVSALKRVEPTIDESKIKIAVKKIGILNKSHESKLELLDNWVEADSITEDVRELAKGLYK